MYANNVFKCISHCQDIIFFIEIKKGTISNRTKQIVYLHLGFRQSLSSINSNIIHVYIIISHIKSYTL